MADPTAPEPVQLFVGILSASDDLLPGIRARLGACFGPMDYESRPFPFDVTRYYEPEMGPGLRRWFVSFEGLIPPDAIVAAKLTTHRIEQAFMDGTRRSVNLDPGYLDTYKVVLASAKFQGPKVYLGQGIYADPTLYYDKGWKRFPWGFPDFRDGRYDEVLTEIRRRYKEKRRRRDGGTARRRVCE